jgi:pSer/pThr/pTyr-binding forkhead associated (FHA) protein
MNIFMAKLVVNPTSRGRREIPLPTTLLAIGRDGSNDLVLRDATVSRRHAVIEYRNREYHLRDCQSSNGSFVNNDRIVERRLRDGDLVAVGQTRLLFRDPVDTDGVTP